VNLTLHISKTFNVNDHYKHNYIKIAVVDLDVSDHYPTNFVCLLPKRLAHSGKYESRFQKQFGEKSQEILNLLLIRALKTVGDLDFIRELKKMLKISNPKPKKLVQCNVCGKDFIAKKFGYQLQTTCYRCINKRNQIV